MAQRESLKTLIPLEVQSPRSIRGSLTTTVNALLEKILAIDRVRRIHDSLPPCSDPYEFLGHTLDRLDIDHTLDEKDRSAIPASGPAIVVANHPFGGIDGIILASVLSSVRKDIKILVNYFLENIPDLRPLFFPVDPFKRKGSSSRNMASIRGAVRWVKTGGMLVILPAGEVSHFSWKRRRIEDPEWSHIVGRMVRLTQARSCPSISRGGTVCFFRLRDLPTPSSVRPCFRERRSKNKARPSGSRWVVSYPIKTWPYLKMKPG